MKNNVTVVDDLMGSGKTSCMIQMINESSNNANYIFVTPFLTEVERIKDNTTKNFIDPKPQLGQGKKVNHVKNLIRQRENIVTTHELFKKFDSETIQLIKENNYILILDEVVDVIKTEHITRRDVEILFEQGLIEFGDKNRIHWIDPTYTGKFNKYKDIMLCDSSYLLKSNQLIWTLPAELFECFKHSYILTYLFDGQYQKYYFDWLGIEYTKMSVESFDFDDYIHYELVEYRKPDIGKFNELITIYEGKHNEIGKSKGAIGRDHFTYTKLSKIKDNPDLAKKIRNSTTNVVRTAWKAKSPEIIWTTYKDAEPTLRGQGYYKGYTSFNLRATNEYDDKSKCVYLLNKFPNLDLNMFFKSQGIIIDSDMYSLSELVQWVFRSAIRKNQPIHLYIPSERMRTLLYRWFNNEI